MAVLPGVSGVRRWTWNYLTGLVGRFQDRMTEKLRKSGSTWLIFDELSTLSGLPISGLTTMRKSTLTLQTVVNKSVLSRLF